MLRATIRYNTLFIFHSQALHFIHLQGFVHLDVKPENILVGYDDRYKLADFDLIQDVKVSNTWCGTPQYLV